MKKFTPILIGALVIIAFTQFSWNAKFNQFEIPITGQTFAVLLVAYILPLKDAILAVLLYILLGVIGLPVFADGGSGVNVLLGNSGGYIIGFIFGTACVSIWSQNRTNTWGNAFLAMLVGTLVIITFGVLRLTINFGFSQALDYGFFLFWIGALFKIGLGTITAKILKDKLNFIR